MLLLTDLEESGRDCEDGTKDGGGTGNDSVSRANDVRNISIGGGIGVGIISGTIRSRFYDNSGSSADVM